MNILYVTSEAVPFCKTGGLADVAGSLPQALAANGDRVSVILPLYERVKDKWGEQLHFEKWTFVRLAWRSVYCGLFSLERDGVTWYFVDNETYFRRSELYGYYDDGERFGRLGVGARAVEQVAREQDDLRPVRPRQLQQSAQKVALLPAALRRLRSGERLKRRIEVQIRRVQNAHAHLRRTGRTSRHRPVSLSTSKIAPSSLAAPMAAS